MALILSIETSTSTCSAALHSGGNTLASFELFLEKSHSGLLGPLINDTIKYAGVEKKDIEAVAVSEGPGSYTGLRIGTSTAKGICFSLDIPLINISTLMLITQSVRNSLTMNHLYCPMIDARRMEVYYALFDYDLNQIQEVQPKVIDDKSFEDELKNAKILFFGNGSDKCKEVIHSPNASYLEGVYPNAESMGLLAWEKFNANNFADPVYFEPFYLKAFKAGKPRQLI